jgi:N-acetylneuraminate lyase
MTLRKKLAKVNGLVAATLTPLRNDQSVNFDVIGCMVEQLINDGVQGLYVCGSTGEGMSLTTQERKRLAQEFVEAAGGRVPVFVQVGHNSLQEARTLAAHAAEIGADAISATCPNYFKVHSVATLIECMKVIACGAPDLPFFYYHIPSLTGSSLSMVQFLTEAANRIPNLAGLKYTALELHSFQRCCQFGGENYQIFWGTDEMLLPALSAGATAAIGSTYNIAAPLYAKLFEAWNTKDVELARRLQLDSIQLIEILSGYPFQAALKFAMSWRSRATSSPYELGGCRLPLENLSSDQVLQLEEQLVEIRFPQFD